MSGVITRVAIIWLACVKAAIGFGNPEAQQQTGDTSCPAPAGSQAEDHAPPEAAGPPPSSCWGWAPNAWWPTSPAGAVREHTQKFSPAWFLAVHATVPFFAFMRKGVGMPRWAIVLTLATAVAGQAIGARLERARLQWGLEKGAEEACPVLKSCSQVGVRRQEALPVPMAVA